MLNYMQSQTEVRFNHSSASEQESGFNNLQVGKVLVIFLQRMDSGMVGLNKTVCVGSIEVNWTLLQYLSPISI